AHGEPLGEENIAAYKKYLNWEYKAFEVPDDVYAHMAALQVGYEKQERAYNEMFAAYREKYPALYQEWLAYHDGKLPEGLTGDAALWAAAGKQATRATSGEILNLLNARLPNLFGGSADLGPSNKCVLNGEEYFSPECRRGKNIHFGVREFAMAAICNGISLYGGLRPFCATFLVFADYLKPALRLSALMGRQILFILTHDSIGVGEDGPTHQPIEQIAALRATPNTYVFRPADHKETAASYLAALNLSAPSAFALTRQNLPQYAETSKEAMRGGYILRDAHQGKADVILMASGSEVELIYQAADILAVQGIACRLVSMPCMDLFEQQDEAYRESVLPQSIKKRVAVEAGAGFGWHKYTGLDGKVVSIGHFGASAPADKLFSAFGITAQAVVQAAGGVALP
ncbi:MAG: transketolase, partial [Clostridiales bacterium]|nr:transketolase [Clostridiales bacterium]